MCGIAGYFVKTPFKDCCENIHLLFKSIRQRGHDDEGICLISRETKLKKFYRTDVTLPGLSLGLDHINYKQSIITHDVGLIHTRYAIIDLTEGGHQPFISQDSSIVAIFNGEIYNYIELKSELSALGIQFRTSSDTEVLVEGYRIWKDRLWSKLNGFWAVALYDSNSNSIVLSRDRLGVAPLYYREMADGFYFSSSIQSLVDIDPDSIEVDKDIVLGFIDTSMKDFDNLTCYSKIKSIPPATVVTFQSGQYKLENSRPNQYWDIPKSRLNAKDISFDEAVLRFRETFFNAVEIRLRADVKVAFELSGGLDSSSVVAAAAIIRNNDISTYTIKVPDQNEEPYARSILEKFPIDYRVLSDPEESFLVDARSFSEIMEEPYHSPNIYTHYRMRKMMKSQSVSVVLAGAGGDEVLSGYEGEFWPKAFTDLKSNDQLWHAFRYEVARKFMTLSRTRRTIRYYGLMPLRFIRNSFGGGRNISNHQERESQIASRAAYYKRLYGELTFHEQTKYHFKVAMLPYYLRSNDHFTMAIPLEHRFPFLDYRIVEMGLRMPTSYLFKNGWTKYILRKAMQPYLPEKILWRKEKMGFPFPYRRFLSINRSTFEPLLKKLGDVGIPMHVFGDYDLLLKTNSTQLWRIVSTALWLEGRI